MLLGEPLQEWNGVACSTDSVLEKGFGLAQWEEIEGLLTHFRVLLVELQEDTHFSKATVLLK